MFQFSQLYVFTFISMINETKLWIPHFTFISDHLLRYITGYDCDTLLITLEISHEQMIFGKIKKQNKKKQKLHSTFAILYRDISVTVLFHHILC